MTAASAWVLAGALWVGCLIEGPWWLALAGGAALAGVSRVRGGGALAGVSRDGDAVAGGGALAADSRGRSARARRLRLAVAAFALLAIGAGLTGGRAEVRTAGLLPALAAAGGAANLGATVVTEPRPVPPRDTDEPPQAWFVVRVTRADGHAVRERAVASVDDLDDAPGLGETVSITASVRPLGDGGFDDHLRNLHAVARVEPAGIEVTGPAGRLLGASTVVRDRTRDAFARRLDPDRAALLAGLVVGDHRGRTAERADQFADAGLSHLVVVSGRHVALMLAVVLGAGALSGMGARGRSWLGLAALGWFVVLVRWQPSVLRAGVMAALVLASGLLGRGRDPRHVLAMAAILLLLADPALAGQLGFALSVLATAGVLLVTPWLAERLPGPRALRLVVAATLGAQTGAAPVLLAWFDGVPLWSVAANVVAVPAAGLAQVLGLVAALAAQVSEPAGGLVAAAAGPPLSVVLWAAETFAAGPRIRAGDLLGPGTALLALAALRARRAPGQAAVALAAAAVLAVWPALRPAPAVERLTLTAFDVGQGDALLVEVPGHGDPARLLYDGGPDEREVAATLRAQGIRRLDAVVMSHPHHDHVAGVAAVVERLDVGALLVGPLPLDAHEEPLTPAVPAAYEAAAATGTPVVPVAAGQRFALGTAEVEVLSPPADGSLGHGHNDNSVVLRISSDDGSILLTGDAEAAAQQRLLARPVQVRADVLQVPHHGGKTNADGFFAAVGASAAVISVGEDNSYGHPHPDVLDALAPTPVRRTDQDGTVRLELDAGAIRAAPSAGRTVRRRSARPVARRRAGLRTAGRCPPPRTATRHARDPPPRAGWRPAVPASAGPRPWSAGSSPAWRGRTRR